LISKAALTINDVGYILYGGTRIFEDETSIILPQHIKAARLKCDIALPTEMD